MRQLPTACVVAFCHVSCVPAFTSVQYGRRHWRASRHWIWFLIRKCPWCVRDTKEYHWGACRSVHSAVSHCQGQVDGPTTRSRIPYDSLLRLSTTFDKIKICIMRMKSSSWGLWNLERFRTELTTARLKRDCLVVPQQLPIDLGRQSAGIANNHWHNHVPYVVMPLKMIMQKRTWNNYVQLIKASCLLPQKYLIPYYIRTHNAFLLCVSPRCRCCISIINLGHARGR